MNRKEFFEYLTTSVPEVFNNVCTRAKFFGRRVAFNLKLKRTIIRFNAKGCNYIDAAYMQRECPGCGFRNEKRNQDGVADIDHFASLIENGWQCDCGYDIPDYWTRFCFTK